LDTNDPTVQPVINCHYLEHPRDRERLREAVHIGVDILKHESFENIVENLIEPTEEDLVSDDTLDQWMLSHVWIGQHLSGTCKMGPVDDQMAVVDQHGRVHGIEGLRVADASIMPNCIRANTNLTTIMIGERIADWIVNSK
jgi:choline dehydrogenase-like flavoprotein